MDILLGKVSKSLKKILYQQNISVFSSYREQDFLNAILYSPNSSLDEDQWFFIDLSSRTTIKNPIPCCSTANSTDWVQVSQEEYSSIRYLALIDKVNGKAFYQKTPSSLLINKPRLNFFGLNDQPEIKCDPIILLNEMPDAVFNETNNKLYFKDISKLTKIFLGIDQLFKEATEEEVSDFVNSSIFSTEAGFQIQKVTTPVRKKITNVQTRFQNFSPTEKIEFIANVRKYLTHINFSNGKFLITSNEDVRDLADALDQRFHDTPITKEKRRTQSYISI